MATKGPLVKIAGIWKQGKGYYEKIGGVWRRIVSTYVKVGGVWKETKVALNSNMVIGFYAGSSSDTVGFYSQVVSGVNVGSMSNPTIGWDTVMRSLAINFTRNNSSVRFTLNLTSGISPVQGTLQVTMTDSVNASIVANMPNPSPYNYYEIPNGAEATSIYNWLKARQGQTITVRGFVL